MQSSERTKLCWNCEGEVGYDAIFCPYCGSDIKRPKSQSMDESQENHYKSLNDSLASLYRPPYLAREDHGYGVPDEREEEVFEEEIDAHNPFAAPSDVEVEEKEPDGRFVWALLFLLLGSQMLTLGLLVLFFSEEGLLTLEWKSQFWFLYCLLSAPLLFVGYKCLSFRKDIS